MLMNQFESSGSTNDCVSAGWCVVSLSLPCTLHFSEECLARGRDRHRALPHPPSRSVGGLRLGCAKLLWFWVVKEEGQGIQCVIRHRVGRGQRAPRSVETLRALPPTNTMGRNALRFGVEHYQPPVHARRCGDVTCSGSSLERGRQTWGAWGHLLFGCC